MLQSRAESRLPLLGRLSALPEPFALYVQVFAVLDSLIPFREQRQHSLGKLRTLRGCPSESKWLPRTAFRQFHQRRFIKRAHGSRSDLHAGDSSCMLGNRLRASTSAVSLSAAHIVPPVFVHSHHAAPSTKIRRGSSFAHVP